VGGAPRRRPVVRVGDWVGYAVIETDNLADKATA
jgi:hypothetical protein